MTRKEILNKHKQNSEIRNNENWIENGMQEYADQQTASLRKELEEAKFSLMDQDRKIISLEEGLHEERAKSGKLVEALKVFVEAVRDEEIILQENTDDEQSGFVFKTCLIALAEYEGKGGSIG